MTAPPNLVALLGRLEELRSASTRDSATTSSAATLYVTTGCAACEGAKRTKLAERLGVALGATVPMVNCSHLDAQQMATLRAHGVTHVPSVLFRLSHDTAIVHPASLVESRLSNLKGDPSALYQSASHARTHA